MATTLKRFVLVPALTLLMAASAFAQQKSSVKINGACAKCGEHLVSTAKSINGVSAASFDPVSSSLIVTHTSSTSALDIALELSLVGYNAGDFKADPKAKSPDCLSMAMRGDDEDMDDLSDDEDLGDWEDADNLDALDRLSDHDDDDLLDEEEEDDSDLEGFEDVDDIGMAPEDGEEDDDSEEK